MKVDIEIGGRAKLLNEGDGTGLGRGMCQAGWVDKGRAGAVDDLQHGGKPVRLGGEPMPERDGKRTHPLAHRHLGADLLDQVGRRLRHTASAIG